MQPIDTQSRLTTSRQSSRLWRHSASRRKRNCQSQNLVFGGHPAITPLVALLLRGMGEQARQRVILYQSTYFGDRFVPESNEFVHLRLFPAIHDSPQDSIVAMRRRMIDDTTLHAGVFIGGMEGVIEEFGMFTARHPHAQVWPIASTGAAALQIFEETGHQSPELFLREMTYPTLFRGLLAAMRL